jgi:phosphoglycerate dehydrogenase-like enzyme
VNKKCFIDPNIVLSTQQVDLINSMNLAAVTYDASAVDFSEIEYFLLHSKLADEQLSQMRNCQYIGIRAHNTDYVNKAITQNQQIAVKGLQHQHGVNAVAEHTFSLIFSLTKNLINSHNNLVQGKWREGLGLNYELNNKKLGIIGNGQIGRRVAELGKAFGMEVLIAGKKSGNKTGELDLETVLQSADVVSLHLSSKQENDNYIDKDRLSLMKTNSILINTARGSVLDYQALEAEIKSGKFLGVGLDVFEEEPLLYSSLTEYSNVILTPHVAYMTNESLDKMNNELLVNLKAFIGA